MKRAIVILNQNSGKGAGGKYKDAIVDKLAKEFSEVELCIIEKEGDAERWGNQARDESIDSVFVVGGDGTVSETVRGMLKISEADDSADFPALGIFPAGTGNGFVRTLGMPPTIEETLDRMNLNCTKSVDIGFVNEIPFTYTVTMGSLPEGIRQVSQEEKARLGFFAYILSEFNKIGNNVSHTFEITLDDETKILQANSIIIFSANTLANHAMADNTIKLDDGWLHILTLKDSTFSSLLNTARALLMHTLDEANAIEYFRAHELRIKCPDENLDCGIDGDDGIDLPLDLSIKPRILQIHACK